MFKYIKSEKINKKLAYFCHHGVGIENSSEKKLNCHLSLLFQDILQNEDIQLDWIFRVSFMNDISAVSPL